MKFPSARAFLEQKSYAISFIGMSGVGKTTMANKLSKDTWFHFSGDYRIGTRYMDESIIDNIKAHAMKDPFLARLLRSDSIYIASNLTFANLDPLSTFLGQLGDPDKGGLSLEEFRRRQSLHRAAEINAMLDVERFKRKAFDLYGYPHFLNDAGGSVVETIDFANPNDPVLQHLVKHTLILYIQASDADIQTLCDRAQRQPKPMYFCDTFLDKAVAEFKTVSGESDPNRFDPDAFTRWSFPQMIEHRKPLYDSIGRDHGYRITSAQAMAIRDEKDFLDVIANAIDAQEKGSADHAH